jgi:HNH endonuclease
MTTKMNLRLSGPKKIHKDNDYYAITLTADEKLRMEILVFTEWTGWADEQCRQELRAASIVNAEYVAKSWAKMKLPYMVINEPQDVMLFLESGGKALIEKCLCEKHFSKYVKDSCVLPDGAFGFADVSLFDAEELKRAPTPKMRMNILRRDDRRRRICGRRPDDYVDLELNVHHIRPWGRGGATKLNNLITLCHTCHKGLDPHFDPSLFTYVQQTETVESMRSALLTGIRNYREAVRRSQ